MLLKIEELLAQAREKVTCLALDEALEKCSEQGGVIIDVREPAEVDNMPVADTINIPRGVLEMQMLQKYPNAEQPIFLHCASGARATLAAEQLNRIGYKHVYVILCQVKELQQKRPVN